MPNENCSVGRQNRRRQVFRIVVAGASCTSLCSPVLAFHQPAPFRSQSPLHSSSWKGDGQDSSEWQSSNDQDSGDWQELLQQKNDDAFWSSFEPSKDDSVQQLVIPTEEQEAEAWLDTLASLSADEVRFNIKEADRADRVRQMQEWGFDNSIIASTLDVATDLSKEKDDVEGMQVYREQSYMDYQDLEKVESHTTVEVDVESGEPVRSRMVYVDEHTCIGCTHCAMTAQSTFFMHSEHGRARVFQQWGDTDETIQIAIETCPVDCIHYVPFEELVLLEVERRDQNINPKARLVSQAEFGSAPSHRVGGAVTFTAPQLISGNMGARCSNCPTRGCFNCPMFGVGLNPEYEKREKKRKERLAKQKLQEQRQTQSKSADL